MVFIANHFMPMTFYTLDNRGTGNACWDIITCTISVHHVIKPMTSVNIKVHCMMGSRLHQNNYTISICEVISSYPPASLISPPQPT